MGIRSKLLALLLATLAVAVTGCATAKNRSQPANTAIAPHTSNYSSPAAQPGVPQNEPGTVVRVACASPEAPLAEETPECVVIVPPVNVAAAGSFDSPAVQRR